MTEPTTPAAHAAAPEPTFDVLPLSPEVRRALEKMGYSHPTPVQRAVFESAAEGRSLVVQARTGTGKTAAFGLPLVDRLVRPALKTQQALVLCPTRELALQVSREVEQIGAFKDVKVVAIYGGASMSKQVDALREGAQIVAGTPGRVLDHLRQGTLDPSQIRVLVLDEADEMLSMGFARELHAILEALPKNRQGLFFSATIPPDIERLAHNNLRDAEIVTLSSDQVGALQISHYVYVMRDGDKVGQLVRIIEVEDPESAVVFCNTRDETQRVAEALKARGFDADWLNGDLPQPDRERVMSATKQGRLRFLVATDVAARGIDISHLTHVINFDFPESAEQYVHRTGRTGRAGRTGTAISIIGPKDIGNLYLLRLTYKIRPIERQLPSAGEMKTRAELDVVQLFIDAFASRSIHADDLALARRLLTHEDAERIVAGLLRDHLGARGGDAPTEAAEARRGRNPPPYPAEPPMAAAPSAPSAPAARGDRGDRGDRGEKRGEHAPAEPRRHRPARPARAAQIERVERAELPDLPGVTISDSPVESGQGEAPSSATPSEDGDFLQVFINVGRREGLQARDLHKILSDKGLGEVSTAGIRVRDRAAFVRVRKDLFDRTIAALSGEVIGGRTVVAELARGR
jgi:ATP-dependent RNA helicase DeaD